MLGGEGEGLGLAGHGDREALELAPGAVGEESGQLPGPDLEALVAGVVHAERPVCGAVQHRGERMADGRADHREAAHRGRGGHPFEAAHACHSLTFSSCSAQVAANLVSPVSVLTATK